MLNPAFPREMARFDTSTYVLPPPLVSTVVATNRAMDVGAEYRLQPVYGAEIRKKLRRLGVTRKKIENSEVLEVCCGGGFLTYHLLHYAHPRTLVLNDISAAEIDSVHALLARHFPAFQRVETLIGDINAIAVSRSFDVIIGNSFLHHIYDVPSFLGRVRAKLKPGGIFVSLHEPTPAALAVEGGDLKSLIAFRRNMSALVEAARFGGPGLQPGGGADVWIFDPDRLADVLKKAGFAQVSIQPWHLLRSLFIARRGAHLSAARPKLSPFEVLGLHLAFRADRILSAVLPASYFGSIAILARVP